MKLPENLSFIRVSDTSFKLRRKEERKRWIKILKIYTTKRRNNIFYDFRIKTSELGKYLPFQILFLYLICGI